MRARTATTAGLDEQATRRAEASHRQNASIINCTSRVSGAGSRDVPVGVRRPLVARQARRLFPLLRALRDRPRRYRRCSIGRSSPGRSTSDRALPGCHPQRGQRISAIGRVQSPLSTSGVRRWTRKERQASESRTSITMDPVSRDSRDHVAGFGQGGCVNSPPSTQRVWPVMKPLSSLARKRTARATSSGRPTRPSGVTAPQVPA